MVTFVEPPRSSTASLLLLTPAIICVAIPPKECDGHGTTAHPTDSRDSAVELDVATEAPGDGPESGDQRGRGRLGRDPAG
jgi:hypothetical protein